MGKVRALKQFKETTGIVPNSAGRERGRPIMVKLHERGVFVKAKGSQGSLFISWDEIFAVAVSTDAKEKHKDAMKDVSSKGYTLKLNKK